MIRSAISEASQNLGSYALFVTENLTYLYEIDDELIEALDSYDMEGMEDKILFVFGIKEDMYFDAVLAKKGFGPVAYKVAMQMQGKLAPYWDRNKVTASAENVWKEFFDGKGSKDVNKELVGVNKDNYRDYWYSLKKPMKFSKNEKIDKDFIGQDKYGERRGMMSEMADAMLINTMNRIY